MILWGCCGVALKQTAIHKQFARPDHQPRPAPCPFHPALPSRIMVWDSFPFPCVSMDDTSTQENQITSNSEQPPFAVIQHHEPVSTSCTTPTCSSTLNVDLMDNNQPPPLQPPPEYRDTCIPPPYASIVKEIQDERRHRGVIHLTSSITQYANAIRCLSLFVASYDVVRIMNVMIHKYCEIILILKIRLPLQSLLSSQLFLPSPTPAPQTHSPYSSHSSTSSPLSWVASLSTPEIQDQSTLTSSSFVHDILWI